MDKSIEFSERFLDPSDRANAVCELEALGQEAIPILRGILDGTAKNNFLVSYNKLGMPVDCSLVVIRRLENSAKELKPFVEYWLERGHPYALEALHAVNST